MATISYPRRPLAVLSARSASPEEILDFLNRHGAGWGYELTVDPGLSSRAVVQVRSLRDRSTVIGILPSYFLIHDPERGGVEFAYDAESLSRFGIDGARLAELIGRVGN